MAMSILPKFLTLKWNISRTIWHIEVGDGSFFCIFHALSVGLFFRLEVPFNTYQPFIHMNNNYVHINNLTKNVAPRTGKGIPDAIICTAIALGKKFGLKWSEIKN